MELSDLAKTNGNGFHPSNNGNLLTVAEVAKRLHAHPHSVRRWADTGLLHRYRIGIRGDRRFLPDDVEEFLAAKTNGYYGK